MRIILLAVVITLSGCRPADSQRLPSPTGESPEGVTRTPRNIIFFISDGCGPASFTMARDFLRLRGQGDLAIDPLLVGSVQTFAANSPITDSAASGTAMACGIKTYNGRLAVDSLGRKVATVLEAAESLGLATGLVATSTITHATPASFSAHVLNRADQDSVALYQLAQNIEVLLGGGADFYLPESKGGLRADGRDLFAEATARGYRVVHSPAELNEVASTPVLGLFTGSHMSYEIDRDPQLEPSLAEMTTRAIELLSQDPEGFFLMVEGSRIDHAGHVNDVPAHLHDILAFDAAVGAALDFARKDGNTMVISTSDHETGGLSVGARVDGRSLYTWEPDRVAKAQQSLEFAADSLLGRVEWVRVLELLGIDDPTEAEIQMGVDSTWSRQALADMMSDRAHIGWTTGGHTAVDVGMYAFGPGSDRFAGHLDNTDIGRTIARLMGVELDDLTEELRRVRSDVAILPARD